MTPLDIFTELLVATMILMIWSMLYKDNVFYRVAENIAIGSYVGFTAFWALDTLYNKTLVPVVTRWPAGLTLVTLFGFLMLTRLIPKVSWPARLSVAVLVGISSGIAVRGAISSQIVRQIASMGSWTGTNVFTNVSNIISTIATATTIIFFTYTIEGRGIVGAIRKIGRYFIMICFGAIMGAAVMSHLSFSIGLAPSLVKGYGVYATMVAFVLIAFDILRSRHAIGSSKTVSH